MRHREQRDTLALGNLALLRNRSHLVSSMVLLCASRALANTCTDQDSKASAASPLGGRLLRPRAAQDRLNREGANRVPLYERFEVQVMEGLRHIVRVVPP